MQRWEAGKKRVISEIAPMVPNVSVPSFRSLVSTIATLLALAVTVNALNNPSRHHLSLVNASPLILHVTFNSPSLKLHGQVKFDVFTTPIVSGNGSSVLYDGYATFIDDGKNFTYSYVNGVGYLSTDDGETTDIQCILLRTLPFDAILPALNEMTPIPSASIGDEMVECTSGKLFKTTFSGSPFAICAAGRSGFMAFSRDFNLNVEFLKSPVQVEVPALSGGLSCNVVATPTSMKPTAVALLTGNAVPASTTRQLKTAFSLKIDQASCHCKYKPRPCVVFHGSGSANELEELQDVPKAVARMGNINDHAPCCSEVKYAILNTMDYSWLDKKLQHKFCDRALRVSKTSDKKERVIRDTVLVTHSMAGLALALAIANGKCSLGEGSSWVAISTPIMGSMASDFAQDYCDNKEYVFSPGQVLELVGQCPLAPSRRDIVYQNERHATKKINKAYVKARKAYKKNVFAALCSDNPNGVISQYEAIMLFTATVVPHKSPQNDGLVEYQSCVKGLNESAFGTSYKNKFYRPALNHADTAFLTHDASWDDSQKPRKWFECLL